MRDIYANAEVVSVYLGELPLPDHTAYTGRVVDIKIDYYDIRENIRELANRSYWSRCWVIQEFVLAKSISVHSSNISWDILYFQEVLCKAAGTNYFEYGAIEHLKNANLIRQWPALSLILERDVNHYPETARSLYDLIMSRPHAQATDLRDRVFALVGLLSYDERRAIEQVFPDYNLTMDQVLVLTLAHLMTFASEHPLRPVIPVLQPELLDSARFILNIADYSCMRSHDVPEWIAFQLNMKDPFILERRNGEDDMDTENTVLNTDILTEGI